MADWHSMRASDADRERAADLLKAAMAEGRLSWPEYQERLDRLMQSKDYGQLQRVISDLPTGISPFPHQQLARPGHPPPHPAMMPPPRQTEPLATASLICGVLMPFTCGVSAIPAVITGHMALSKLNRTQDDGKGMAVAGLILGYLPIAFMIVAVLGALPFWIR